MALNNVNFGSLTKRTFVQSDKDYGLNFLLKNPIKMTGSEDKDIKAGEIKRTNGFEAKF